MKEQRATYLTKLRNDVSLTECDLYLYHLGIDNSKYLKKESAQKEKW